MKAEDYEQIVTGMEVAFRAERNSLKMQLILYRSALVEAGIEPPDASGEDLLQMWTDAAAVINTASEFVHHLGTSRELLDNWQGNGSKDTWSVPFRRWLSRQEAPDIVRGSST